MLMFIESVIVYDLKLFYKNLVVIKLKIYILKGMILESNWDMLFGLFILIMII